MSTWQWVVLTRKGYPTVPQLAFHLFLSRSNLKGAANAEEARPGSQFEAAKRLEDQRRRRGENEEFERLKEKQQEAAAELDELKKRREERRKILEEEEQKKKQEEAERKAREEVRIKYEELNCVFIHFFLLLCFHWPCITW